MAEEQEEHTFEGLIALKDEDFRAAFVEWGYDCVDTLDVSEGSQLEFLAMKEPDISMVLNNFHSRFPDGYLARDIDRMRLDKEARSREKEVIDTIEKAIGELGLEEVVFSNWRERKIPEGKYRVAVLKLYVHMRRKGFEHLRLVQ